MNTEQKALKYAESALNEMYKKSVPSITWKQFKNKYSGTGILGYEKHYLDKNICLKIWNKWEKKCPKRYKSGFGLMLLDYSPTGKPLGKGL